MTKRIPFISLLIALAIALTACGGESLVADVILTGEDSETDGATGGDPAATPADDDASQPASGAAAPVSDRATAVETAPGPVDLGGTVTKELIALSAESYRIGAFDIRFEEAAIETWRPAPEDEEWLDPIVVFRISFAADNISDVLHRPLGGIGNPGLVLTVGDEALFDAELDAADVPGGLSGSGTIYYGVPLTVPSEALYDAVLTIGQEGLNQAVLPIGNLGEPVYLRDIPVDFDFRTEVSNVSVQIGGDAYIAFGSENDNELLAENVGLLMASGALEGTPGLSYSEFFGSEHTFLTRPDGTSITAESVIELVDVGDRNEGVDFNFLVSAPFAGDYTIGVELNGESDSTTFTVG